MALNCIKIHCAEGILFLNLTFLKLNVDICVLIVYICTSSVKVNASIAMLDTAVSQQSSTQNIFPNPIQAFMWLRALKMSAKEAKWDENLTPQSVLNASGCDIAETWMILHSKQKHNLSPLPKIANKLQKGGERLTIASPFLTQVHKNAMIESGHLHVFNHLKNSFESVSMYWWQHFWWVHVYASCHVIGRVDWFKSWWISSNTNFD